MNFVYLIHFDRKFHHAQHYIGATTDLARRIQTHHLGNGSKLVAAIADAGITWRVIRTWTTDNLWEEENLAKRQKHGPLFCPICTPTRTKRLRGATSYDLTLLPKIITERKEPSC